MNVILYYPSSANMTDLYDITILLLMGDINKGLLRRSKAFYIQTDTIVWLRALSYRCQSYIAIKRISIIHGFDRLQARYTRYKKSPQ